MRVFEAEIKATSHEWAPWYVITPDKKWMMRSLTSSIITEKILSLDLEFQALSAWKNALLAEITEELKKESLRVFLSFNISFLCSQNQSFFK